MAPEKTRLLRFGRFSRRDARRLGETAATFDFLGFRHRCGTSRSGRFKVKWSTSSTAFRSKLRAFKDWLKANRTMPLPELWKLVNAKLRGYYAYFSVSDNWSRLLSFKMNVLFLLYKWLNRRSQRPRFDRRTWLEYVRRVGIATPQKVVANLNASFRERAGVEPDAGKPHVRF